MGSRPTAGESVVRSGPERRLKCFCAAFLRDPICGHTFNSSQPLPDCNMNKFVFVPPLASHLLVGYKHEGAYFLAHEKQRVGDENLGHATWAGWAWLESRG